VLRAATLLALSVPLAFAQRPPDEIDLAFGRLYNFDFNGAHAILTKRIAATPNEPLPYAVRASAYLFYELDRLSILETEFFSNDSRIADKKKIKPDPAVRANLLKALEDAQFRADALLAKNLRFVHHERRPYRLHSPRREEADQQPLAHQARRRLRQSAPEAQSELL
jgi:hypothetical protein